MTRKSLKELMEDGATVSGAIASTNNGFASGGIGDVIRRQPAKKRKSLKDRVDEAKAELNTKYSIKNILGDVESLDQLSSEQLNKVLSIRGYRAKVVGKKFRDLTGRGAVYDVKMENGKWYVMRIMNVYGIIDGWLTDEENNLITPGRVKPQGVAEGAMPASVIKQKESIRLASDEENKKRFKGKTKAELAQMARRHGYGDKNPYAKFHDGVTESTHDADNSLTEIKKGQKDSNGYTKCWPGKHAEGTKKGKNGGQVRNCVPNESIETEDRHPNEEPYGPEFKPTMPKGTVRVDVSDVYDWYKLGKNISNLKGLDTKDFGKGPPSTIVSFGDEDTEHKYINDLENLGLETTDIDPVDPKQPKGMKRQKVDPTYNVGEASSPAQQAAIAIAKKKKKQKVDEMDKSAPQPGRDGHVSHSTYGRRDDYNLGDPETTLGPEHILKKHDAIKQALAVLDKSIEQYKGKKQKVDELDTNPTKPPASKKSWLDYGMPDKDEKEPEQRFHGWDEYEEQKKKEQTKEAVELNLDDPIDALQYHLQQLTEAPIEIDRDDPTNPMIYGHNKANPAKLQYRMMRAAGQLKELAERVNKAQDAESLIMWQSIVANFKELAMNVDQIGHALEELEQTRRKGGVNSRGIPDLS